MTSHTLLSSSPGVGFEQPFEMLEACHERVQRSVGLLERLLVHIEAHGHDASSRSAAADVLRYFDIAAPLHHEDEELHIFPPLEASADVQMRETIAQLKLDHVRMSTMWAELRQVIQAWRDADPAPAVSEDNRTLIREFARSYAQHIPLEETLVYPAARAAMASRRILEVGEEMASRRRR